MPNAEIVAESATLTSSEQKSQKKALVELMNDECPNYLKRTRVYGEGEIRIGHYIPLNDDIYSIGFISQLRDDLMIKFIDIMAGKLHETEGHEHKNHHHHIEH